VLSLLRVAQPPLAAAAGHYGLKVSVAVPPLAGWAPASILTRVDASSGDRWLAAASAVSLRRRGPGQPRRARTVRRPRTGPRQDIPSFVLVKLGRACGQVQAVHHRSPAWTIGHRAHRRCVVRRWRAGPLACGTCSPAPTATRPSRPASPGCRAERHPASFERECRRTGPRTGRSRRPRTRAGCGPARCAGPAPPPAQRASPAQPARSRPATGGRSPLRARYEGGDAQKGAAGQVAADARAGSRIAAHPLRQGADFSVCLPQRKPNGVDLGAGVPVVDLIRVAYAGDEPVEVFVSVRAGDRHVSRRVRRPGLADTTYVGAVMKFSIELRVSA